MGVWRGSQPTALRLEFDYTIQAFGLIIAVPPRKWYNRLEFRFRPGTSGGFGFLTINNLPGKPKFNSWLRYHLLLLLAYFLLAAVLTWPTLPHLTTHLPGDGGDDPAIAWNFWWLKYALLNLRQNPFQSNFLFYPIGINLAFYTLTVLNAVTALPLTLNFGVVAASNLHLLFTFVSGGYGAFLLARHVLTTADPLKSRGAGERGSGGDIPPCPPAPLPPCSSLARPSPEASTPLPAASSSTWLWANSTLPAVIGFPGRCYICCGCNAIRTGSRTRSWPAFFLPSRPGPN